MSEHAAAYLAKMEWSMGNGQCPECHGCGPLFSDLGMFKDRIGHRDGCIMAAAINELRTPQPVTPAGGDVPCPRCHTAGDDFTCMRCGQFVKLVPPPVADAALVRDAERFRALAKVVTHIKVSYSEPNDCMDDYLARMADAALNQRGGHSQGE